jgi:tetratricopeptide (TPR) repeat protein
MANLKPNDIVRGSILPEPLKVIAVIPMSESVRLIGQGQGSGQSYETTLSAAQVAELEVSSEHRPPGSATNASPSAELLTRAERQLRDGQLQQAEALCRQALESEPANADVLHLLGQTALRTGRSQEAVGALRRALDVNGRDPRYHFDLGNALSALRDFEGAEKAYAEALSLQPNHAEAQFGLGICLEARSRLAQAESAYRRAVALRPEFPEALNNLGSVLLRMNRPAEALESLQLAVAQKPDFLAARFNRGTACYELRKLAEAESDFRVVLERHPEHPGALNELGRVLLNQTRAAEAAELFCRGHRRHPKDARFLVNLATALEALNDLSGAEEAANMALKLQPKAPPLIYGLASLEHRRGRLAEARDRLQALLAQPLADELRAEALMELGQVLDGLGDTGAAFRAVAEGNALRAGSPAARRVDGGRFLQRVAASRSWFTRAPIFFVGFPRSGTTLMERALKAHPRILTTDERSPLTAVLRRVVQGGAYPGALECLTDEQLETLRDLFWTRAEALLGPLEGRVVVDKFPLNIVHLGLANGLFPEARVVVALRDPRDACLSCFMQRFQFNDAMVNFCDLQRTAATYGAVMDLWRHYRGVLSLPWHEYRYEDMVEDFEGVLRGVLAFIGLPWHEDVMAYREKVAQQAITTPSYRQVTREIYKSAAGRWRGYQEALAPILPTLQPFAADFGYPEA